MVTLYDGPHLEYKPLVEPGKRRYCERHGIDFFAYDKAIDQSRPPSWSKILALQSHLASYDWLYWCDADSVVLNPEIPLTDYLVPSANNHLQVAVDCNGINMGCFFIRNSEWAHRLLARIWARDDEVNHGWWEQWALMKIMREDEQVRSHMYTMERVSGDTCTGFNGYWCAKWSKPTIHEPDAAIIHLTGVPHQERLKMLRLLAAEAEKPKERRSRRCSLD